VTGRQRRRGQAGGVSGMEVFHYDGPGDSPSWTALGSTWSRNIPGIGGELAAVQESTGTTTFKLTDLHGDVIATASSSPTATKLLATFRSDEFGEPVSSPGAGRFGWLGGKSRRTELSSGVIQMGARSYIPQLGRFLTPDPVPGGSANAYDYADQDPVNLFDLDGHCPKNSPSNGCSKGGKNGSHVESKREGRRRSRREIRVAIRSVLRTGAFGLTFKHAISRKKQESVFATIKNAVTNAGASAGHWSIGKVESVVSSVGGTISSAAPSCATLGLWVGRRERWRRNRGNSWKWRNRGGLHWRFCGPCGRRP
jgi:RHS repeat-associated protein